MEKIDLKESLIGHALLYLASWQERLSENAHQPLKRRLFHSVVDYLFVF